MDREEAGTASAGKARRQRTPLSIYPHECTENKRDGTHQCSGRAVVIRQCKLNSDTSAWFRSVLTEEYECSGGFRIDNNNPEACMELSPNSDQVCDNEAHPYCLENIIVRSKKATCEDCLRRIQEMRIFVSDFDQTALEAYNELVQDTRN